MAESLKVWIKKVYSLTLILNSLITLAALAGILYGFYHSWPNWKPYWPYLVDGNILLFAAAAALINIFPEASIGRKLHTGRFLFHHYVYGFLTMTFASIFVIGFTSVGLISLFIVPTANVAVNTGRLFVLTGLALFLDDLPDVNKRIESVLNRIKAKAFQIRRAIHFAQFISRSVTLYAFVAIACSAFVRSSWTVAVYLTLGTMVITSITSFVCVARKSWLKITIE